MYIHSAGVRNSFPNNSVIIAHFAFIHACTCVRTYVTRLLARALHDPPFNISLLNIAQIHTKREILYVEEIIIIIRLDYIRLQFT